MHRAATFLLATILTLAAPAHAQAPSDAETPQATAASAQAIYVEGKQLYDAGDYQGARARFSEAVRRDPDNPRWHYSLGLAQRQLDNYQAARQSLLRARELSPDYKRAEIDQKLADMGFAASGGELRPGGRHAAHGGSAVPWPLIGGVGLGATALVGLILFRSSRRAQAQAQAMAARLSPLDGAALDAEEQRLHALGAQLARIEHAMRLGEHADLRSQLEYATRLEAAARQALAQARHGDQPARAKFAQSLREAEEGARRAADLATRLYGERAFAEAGDKVGCFFSARQLARFEEEGG